MWPGGANDRCQNKQLLSPGARVISDPVCSFQSLVRSRLTGVELNAPAAHLKSRQCRQTVPRGAHRSPGSPAGQRQQVLGISCTVSAARHQEQGTANGAQPGADPVFTRSPRPDITWGPPADDAGRPAPLKRPSCRATGGNPKHILSTGDADSLYRTLTTSSEATKSSPRRANNRDDHSPLRQALNGKSP